MNRRKFRNPRSGVSHESLQHQHIRRFRFEHGISQLLWHSLVHLCNASRIMRQWEWFAQSQELATVGGSGEHSTDHTVKRLVRKIYRFSYMEETKARENEARIVRESGGSPQRGRHFVRACVRSSRCIRGKITPLLASSPAFSSPEEQSRFQK